MTEKTHWLQNPNKNYLGHWDLPEGKDLILTIVSAKWEEVENPVIRTVEAKRVIRFRENNIKPFICNQTNAQTILKSTGVKYMEDSIDLRIQLGLGQTKVMGEIVDCLRVRNIPQDNLQPIIEYINEAQFTQLNELLNAAKKDKIEFCEAMKIDSINKLPSRKFESVAKRLNQMIESNANN